MQTKAQIYYQQNKERLNAYSKQWYLANRDRLREKNIARAKAWNDSHPMRVSQNAKLRYLRDKGKTTAEGLQWRNANPEVYKASLINASRKFRLANPWYDSWQAARQRCTNPKNPRYKYYGAKGIVFDLLKADCAALWIRDNAKSLQRPSLDRIDPAKGYVFDNCRFIELSENTRKRFSDMYLKRLKDSSMSPRTRKQSAEIESSS